jgi:hypothetical protein
MMDPRTKTAQTSRVFFKLWLPKKGLTAREAVLLQKGRMLTKKEGGRPWVGCLGYKNHRG